MSFVVFVLTLSWLYYVKNVVLPCMLFDHCHAIERQQNLVLKKGRPLVVQAESNIELAIRTGRSRVFRVKWNVAY
jgi:hypothetical protein